VETELDTVLAYDIELFLENDSEIYHKNIVPVLRMISKHYDKGRGDKQDLREYVASELFDKWQEGLENKNSTDRYW